MTPLLSKEIIQTEKKRLKNMIRYYAILKDSISDNPIDKSCKNIGMAALVKSINEKISYLRRWNIDLNDDTLHGWRM